MSIRDLARRCTRCSQLARRPVDHFPDEPHYRRWRLWWLRLRRR